MLRGQARVSILRCVSFILRLPLRVGIVAGAFSERLDCLARHSVIAELTAFGVVFGEAPRMAFDDHAEYAGPHVMQHAFCGGKTSL